MRYEPTGFYAKVFRTELGLRLWAFLLEDRSLLIMEVADNLRRPAIEAITPYLLIEFGNEPLTDHVKRTVGNMVGAIKRQQGKDVVGYTKLRDSRVFGRGAIFA